MRCAKHRAVCERDLEKPKQRVCMKCAGLKEKCEWPEVEGPGPVAVSRTKQVWYSEHGR